MTESLGGILFLLTLFACTQFDLPSVPILGGSSAARSLAREELVAFDEAIGPGRLRIHSVGFEPLGPHEVGKFYKTSQRILIRDSAELENVRIILRHELCHALDYGEDLLEEPHPGFDALGDLVPDSHKHPQNRPRRSEALALFCEMGPDLTMAIEDACPEDPPLAQELASWTLDQVWSNAVPALSLPPIGPPFASFTAPHPWDYMSVSGTASSDQISIALKEGEGGWEWFSIDRLTGAEREESLKKVLPPLLSEGLPQIYGWPDGPTFSTPKSRVPLLGLSQRRLLLSPDGIDEGFVPGLCLTAGRWDVFTVDDTIWYAWGDGLDVYWVEATP